MRIIDRHILHCSDSDFGDVNIIRKWHVEERGWSDIGYHFVIRQDGVIEIGRPVEIMGAHCKGLNRNSIGTCLIGVDEFTEEQFISLRKLHKTLQATYGKLAVNGHNEFSSTKTCPNFNVKEAMKP